MYMINWCASNVNDKLPYGNLSSFDSFKTETLYETRGESNTTIYSDRIRSYKNYSELSKKYKIGDVYSGTTISVIQDFVRELLESDELMIVKISVSIDGRGYPIYCIQCSK